MPPVSGTELEQHKTVFRFIPDQDRFIPPGARFPNGEAFEPSSEDKKGSPIRVTVWDTSLTTAAQARSLRPERGPALPYGLRVADVVEIRNRLEPRLRVVAEPIEPPTGPGSDGHCGMEGLDRLSGASKKIHKAKLDEVAQKAFPLPEAPPTRTVTPLPQEELGETKRYLEFRALARRYGWALLAVAVVAAVALRSPQRTDLEIQGTKNEAARQIRAVESEAAQKIFEAFESTEGVDVSPANAPSSPRSFVFLGTCDRVWSHVLFDGLPPCDRPVPIGGIRIRARIGIKARGAPPSHGQFGSEVSRLSRGDELILLAFRSVTIAGSEGPQILWGEVEAAVRSQRQR